MPANVQTMAYVGEVPWHGLGQRVEREVHANEMLQAAGLNWTVEKRPARGSKPIRVNRDKREIYSRYEIVRMPRPNAEGEEEVVLGIVTDKYQPLQNEEAFAFFDPLVDRKTAFFETAGALGEGERVWVMAKMPEAIQVVRSDECQKYLLLSNTHSGRGSILVKFTAVRVVCQNTLMLATEDGQPAFRVRHSKIMSERLGQIAKLIAAANRVFTESARVFRQLVRVQLNAGLLNEYLEAVYPKSDAQERNGESPPKWGHVRQLLESLSDLQLEGVRGTLWAAFNAITRFEDYRMVPGEVAGTRLDRVWFGTGADIKLRALQAATKLATAG